jgi:hypothetical protein
MAEASVSRRASSTRNAFAGFAKAVAGTAFLIAVGTAAIMVYTSRKAPDSCLSSSSSRFSGR